MIDIFLLVLGIGGLWAATELVVGGAVAIAAYYGMSEFFVGLIILSIGSDLPELAVALESGWKTLNGVDASGIVIGSAIGSSFGQIGGVMGVAGLLGYLVLPKRIIYQYGSVLLGSLILLFLTGFDGTVSRIEGSILLVVFLIYMFTLFHQEKLVDDTRKGGEDMVFLHWLRLAGGLILIFLSSDLTISSAIGLSTSWGVSQTVISVIFIGFGTSLPELTISVGAVLKKKGGLSVGNLIGSNIFDTLVPVGVAALFAPVLFERKMLVLDLPLLFGLSLLVFVFFLIKRGLQRREAIALLIYYGSYLVFKVVV